jgi:hypothetical protein
VLLTSAAVLVLEILVSRLVAPYVGLTLETYTAAIGVALAAIAAGRRARRPAGRRGRPAPLAGLATAVGGALVLAPAAVFAVGDAFRGSGPVGTVVLVLLAVAPAALVLSLVPPGVVKLRLRTLAETGATSAGCPPSARSARWPAPSSPASCCCPRCPPRRCCWSPAACWC